jgi:hypothetical protein
MEYARFPYPGWWLLTCPALAGFGCPLTLQGIGSIYFFDFEFYRANEASDIAKKSSMPGMDAIVLQIAKEFDAILVSLDDEMIDKAKGIVKVESVEALV